MPATLIDPKSITIRQVGNALKFDTPWGHFDVPSTRDPEHPAVSAKFTGNSACTHVGDLRIDRVGIDWEPLADGTGRPTVWWGQPQECSPPFVALVRESDGSTLSPIFTGTAGDGFYTVEYGTMADRGRFWVVFILLDTAPSAVLLSPMEVTS